MILIIDNYDSFTFNLYQYLREIGADVLVKRNDELTLSDVQKLAPQKIVISPGPCSPNEAGISLALIHAFAGRIPILGICLGHQAIAQAFGGRVIVAPQVKHGKVSRIRHDATGVFVGLPQDFAATRYHSLIVEESSLPDCLQISARAEDGVIMGIRHKTLAVEGVQFHPESILTQCGRELLKNFSSSCRESRATAELLR